MTSSNPNLESKICEMLFNRAIDSIAVYDVQFNTEGKAVACIVTHANQSYLDFLQKPVEQVINKNILDIIPSLSSTWIDRYATVLKTQQQNHFEEYIPELKKYVAVEVIPLNKTGFATISRDITEQREEMQLLEQLFYSSPVPLAHLDANNAVLSINTAFEKEFQYTIDEMRGKNLRDFIVPKEEVDKSNDFSKRLMNGETIITETTRRRKDNTVLPVQFYAFPTRNNGSGITGAYASYINQTVEKDAVLKLLQYNIELTHTNEAKDKFFSIIAHDLKSPFHGFLGITEILVDEYDSLSPDELSEIAKELNAAAKNTYNLVNNLLTWSQVMRKKIEYTPKSVDLYAIVSQTIEQLDLPAKNKHNRVYTDLAPETKIYADKQMLTTIVRNLVNNAIKFTHDGKIKVSYVARPDTHELIISDTGIGMNESKRNSLFKTASASSSEGTDGESGTGLGLLLCDEFVKYHNGSISVESEVGKGSTFHITLPKYAPLIIDKSAGEHI